MDSAIRSLYNRPLDILGKEEIVCMIIYLRINEDNKQIISEDELSTDLSHSDRLVLREDRLHECLYTTVYKHLY